MSRHLVWELFDHSVPHEIVVNLHSLKMVRILNLEPRASLARRPFATGKMS
jgi:hypothetical protein